MAIVNLVTGPAGSGKTQRVLAELLAEIRSQQSVGRLATTLWITPTKRSRRQVLRSLVNRERPACFGVRVLTFEAFAEQILQTGPAAIRSLGQVAGRKLLRDLIDDLVRRRRLKYFANVAGTTGFLDLCISFISELKRAEVWPEELIQFLQRAEESESPTGSTRRRTSPKSREIVEIYDAYQRRLHAADGATLSRDIISGLYDAEGRFWSVRTLMKSGHRGPFQHLGCVVVDGFTDFTRTQHEMLDTLAGWTRQLWITVPGESPNRGDSARSDLFSKAEATRNALRVTFAKQALREFELSPKSSWNSTTFGHLAAHLFDNPRKLNLRHEASGLKIMSCVRQMGELEAVAKRIKSLLLQGVSADDIVVTFRALEEGCERIRHAFSEAGIPAAIDAGHPLLAAGVLRFLLSMFELELEDWPFQRLMSLFNSGFYRSSHDAEARMHEAHCVASVLRSLNLDSGREVILKAVGRHAERGGRLERELNTAHRALQRFSEQCDVLRTPTSFSNWVDRTLVLATTTGLIAALADFDEFSTGVSETEAWDAFVSIIEEAKYAEGLSGATPRSLGLAEFQKQLLELLFGRTCGGNSSEAGRVRVLSADHVRNLEIPHLFVCGLNESAFPKSRGDDCFYSDTERNRLTDQGLPLGHRARHSLDEMLLFYSVVTRARRSLTLTYASVDDAGEPLNASPYIEAVTQLFEQGRDLVEVLGGLDPVQSSVGLCATESELRVYATSEALAGRGGLFQSLLSREASAQSALNIVAAAEMASARFETRGLTRFEGVLSDPRNLKRLRTRFGVAHEFSATELQAYAEHPFRFFLAVVLGLDSSRSPGPGTDHAKRGSAIHAALAALHRNFDGFADDSERDFLVEQLREEISRAVGTVSDTPLQRALRRIERDILSARAAHYGDQWESYLKSLSGKWDSPPRPLHLEVAFGNAPAEENETQEERHPLVEFGESAEKVRVRGRIDRIDVGLAAGRPVFNVIDYKLSRKPRTFDVSDIELGHSLQLALYAMAVRQLGFVDADLFQFGFWSLNGDGFVCGLKQRKRDVDPIGVDVLSAIEGALKGVLPRLAQAIRSGQFPIVPEDPSGTHYPDFGAVARTASFRAVADRLQKTLSRESPASPTAPS